MKNEKVEKIKYQQKQGGSKTVKSGPGKSEDDKAGKKDSENKSSEDK